jgi:hypothetical protein
MLRLAAESATTTGQDQERQNPVLLHVFSLSVHVRTGKAAVVSGKFWDSTAIGDWQQSGRLTDHHDCGIFWKFAILEAEFPMPLRKRPGNRFEPGAFKLSGENIFVTLSAIPNHISITAYRQIPGSGQ